MSGAQQDEKEHNWKAEYYLEKMTDNEFLARAVTAQAALYEMTKERYRLAAENARLREALEKIAAESGEGWATGAALVAKAVLNEPAP